MDITPILVALFGGLILFAGHRYNAYRTASAKFRGVVLEALADFYPTFTRWDGAFFGQELQAKFSILQAAVADFESCLPGYKRAAFRKAWVSYCNATGRECDMNTYLHYFDSYSPGGTQAEATEKAQALFHSNVDRLLSYAKKT